MRTIVKASGYDFECSLGYETAIHKLGTVFAVFYRILGEFLQFLGTVDEISIQRTENGRGRTISQQSDGDSITHIGYMLTFGLKNCVSIFFKYI